MPANHRSPIEQKGDAMKARRYVVGQGCVFIIMQSIILGFLILFTLDVNAMEIDAKDAQAEMGKTSMTLKRVHSGGSDYIFHMSWDSSANSWKLISFEKDYGYGWRPEAKMPIGVDWAGSAVWGKYLYVVGGSGHCDKISIYNSLTNQWTQRTVYWMGYLLRAAACSSKIYIFDTSDAGCPMWIYDLDTKTMSSLSITPPNLKWTSEPAVSNDKIYFFGGYGPKNTVWEFNPQTFAFKKKADLPTAGYAASTAVLNEKIYVIGGNYRRDKIEVYDPKANTWEPSLSFAGLSLSGWDTAAPVGNKIVITDAETGNTFLFNPVSQALTTQESLPEIRYDYLTGESLGGRLYVAGGEGARNRLDSFKPGLTKSSATTWSPQSEMQVSTTSKFDYEAKEAQHMRRMEEVRRESKKVE